MSTNEVGVETQAGRVSHIVGSRLYSVDCLRGGAALAVVLSHAITYGTHPPLAGADWFRISYEILSYGHLGVPLFFVLSGFCIHLPWARQTATTGKSVIDFKKFWKRRLRRLYPPYVVMLCISMSLVVVAYMLGREVPLVTLYPEPRPYWMAFDFLAHLTMLHGLHPTFDRAGGNPPFWTLAREEYFYLMYFALLAWRRHWGAWNSLGVVLALGLAFPLIMKMFLAADSSWWQIVNTSAIVLWVQWCLGMLAAEGYCGLLKLPRWCKTFWMVPIWALAALLSDKFLYFLSPFLWGVTFFTFLNGCVARECAGNWPRRHIFNWLANVGLFSYSLYLVHNPVRAVGKQLLAARSETSNPLIYLIIAFGLTIGAYYAAIIFFMLIERRFLNKPSEIAQQQSVPA